MNKRTWILGLAATAALVCTGAAQAHGVQWSIGLNLPLPPLPTLISSGPVYGHAPVAVYGAPVYAPVYDTPVYDVPPVVYRTPRYVEPRYVEPRAVIGWRGGHEARWAPARPEFRGRPDGDRNAHRGAPAREDVGYGERSRHHHD